MSEFKIATIDYRDFYGNLLWSEAMIFNRLHAVGETIVMNSKEYKIRRVAVADTVQHVTFEDQP